MSLAKQTFKGVIWTTSQKFGIKILSLLLQIVLGRILNPSDFAPIALLTVFVGISSALIDGGLTSSLIKTNDTDDEDYSTVFWINFLGSIGIYIILFFTSPYIAQFYDMPILDHVIKLYSVSIVVSSLTNVQNARLTKDMAFKTQTKIAVPSFIVGGLVGVWGAMNGMGVYALVWMAIVQSLTNTILLWYSTGWRPKLVFNKIKFKKHFSYSYKMTLSGILNSLFTNIYTIIIGKQFSPATLGLYNRAEVLKMFPVQSVAQALNTVTFPMFAKIQDDNARLKVAYKKIMKMVLFIFAPLYALLFLIADPLVYFILGEKWLDLVPFFQLMCLSGILYPLHSYNLNILMVKGRTDLFLYLEIAKKVLTVIGVIIALPYGIYGLLYFQIINSFLAYIINSFYSGKMIDYNTWHQIKDVAIYFIISFISGAVVYYTRMMISIDNYLFTLFYSTLIFGIVYLGLCYVCKVSQISPLKNLAFKK